VTQRRSPAFSAPRIRRPPQGRAEVARPLSGREPALYRERCSLWERHSDGKPGQPGTQPGDYAQARIFSSKPGGRPAVGQSADYRKSPRCLGMVAYKEANYPGQERLPAVPDHPARDRRPGGDGRLSRGLALVDWRERSSHGLRTAAGFWRHVCPARGNSTRPDGADIRLEIEQLLPRSHAAEGEGAVAVAWAVGEGMSIEQAAEWSWATPERSVDDRLVFAHLIGLAPRRLPPRIDAILRLDTMRTRSVCRTSTER